MSYYFVVTMMDFIVFCLTFTRFYSIFPAIFRLTRWSRARMRSSR